MGHKPPSGCSARSLAFRQQQLWNLKFSAAHTLEGQVVDLEALVRALLAGDDRRIADQRIVDARIRHQVGLELVQVDVESTIEAQAGSD